jgi:tetratricopeptide (TPR) repeat protein
MNEFLKSSSVLIVSSRPGHRSSVKKILMDLGLNNNNIEASTDFISARERFSLSPVNILVMDDEIGNQGSAVDLLKLFHSNNSNKYSRLAILMPRSETEDLCQEFMLNGGDLIIEKPFTTASFLLAFNKIIEEKYAYSPDEIMAFDVEEALEKNDKNKAMEYCKTFKNLNSPSASYSIGLINLYENNFDQAFQSFQKSLKYKFDTKVLIKLLSSGLKIKKYKELNDYVEHLLRETPVSTELAKDVARVVLYNKNFNLFSSMRILENESKIPLAAGLVVASSVFLERGDVESSIQYALKAIEHSSNKSIIILKAVEILILAGDADKAHRVFSDLKLNSMANTDSELIRNLESLFSS